MFNVLVKNHGFWTLIASICYILIEIGVSYPTYSVVDYIEFVILGTVFLASLCSIIIDVMTYKKRR